MSFTPFVIVWGVLALIVAALLVYRIVVGYKEDDSLHLHNNSMELAAEKQQVAKAHSLETTEKLGKILTVVTALYGVALLCVYSYKQLY